jgi:hypothetical protein
MRKRTTVRPASPGKARRDRGLRKGNPAGFEKSLRGPEDPPHGAYVEKPVPLQDPSARRVGAKRKPYVGTRMGDWDETGRPAGSVAAERAQHASSCGDDQDGGGGACPTAPKATRSQQPVRKRKRKPR